jgi:CRISPR system Cascade subunit CasD
MPEFLTFALYAPIASFGAPAVGERRGSFDRPARSAILGLIGACLGLDRAGDAAQAALTQGYGLAVRAEAPGVLLADYHTAQMPPARRGRRFATRAAELAVEDLSTVLSRRDYRSDAWHLAALWALEGAHWPLSALAEAMARPAFTPSLGRKSCPLGLPLAPAIGNADTPVAALAVRAETGPERLWRDTLGIAAAGAAIVAMDANDWSAGLATLRTERRRDAPLSRRRWQFALRDEIIVAAS